MTEKNPHGNSTSNCLQLSAHGQVAVPLWASSHRKRSRCTCHSVWWLTWIAKHPARHTAGTTSLSWRMSLSCRSYQSSLWEYYSILNARKKFAIWRNYSWLWHDDCAVKRQHRVAFATLNGYSFSKHVLTTTEFIHQFIKIEWSICIKWQVNLAVCSEETNSLLSHPGWWAGPLQPSPLPDFPGKNTQWHWGPLRGHEVSVRVKVERGEASLCKFAGLKRKTKQKNPVSNMHKHEENV
jgi:hypothetical protein